MNNSLKLFNRTLFSLPNLVVTLFFIILISVGLSSYKNYGISWDEPIGKSNGVISALYVNHKFNYLFFSKEKIDALIDKSVDKIQDKQKYTDVSFLHDYKDKDYGVVFEFYLAGIQFLMGDIDGQSIYQIRHLFTFFFFLFSVFIFYLLGLEIFKDWKLALLTCLFLVLSPRIFAHSFYNSKDIPFMSVYIWTLYTMVKFLKHKNIKWAIFHAITSAILIAIRIPGIIIPAITLLFLIFDETSRSFLNALKRQRLKAYSIYFVFLPLLIIVFWPYLWEDPLGNFIDSFHNFSRFRSDTYLLFWGDIIWTKDLPWYYTISWMLITTPILYVLLFIAGSILLIKNVFIKIKKWEFYRHELTRNKLLITASFLGPLIALIVFNSVLYNGWRHSYFIYPSILIISISTLPTIISYSKQIIGDFGRKITITIVSVYMLYMAFASYRLYPYQQDYFNFLAGSSIEQNFDLDYWGLSCKEAIEYLIEKEGRNSFSIGAHITYPITLNTNMFTTEQKNRIQINNLGSNNDYLFIRSNEKYKFPEMKTLDFSNYKQIKVISAGEIPLLEIYEAKKPLN